MKRERTCLAYLASHLRSITKGDITPQGLIPNTWLLHETLPAGLASESSQLPWSNYPLNAGVGVRSAGGPALPAWTLRLEHAWFLILYTAQSSASCYFPSSPLDTSAHSLAASLQENSPLTEISLKWFFSFFPVLACTWIILHQQHVWLTWHHKPFCMLFFFFSSRNIKVWIQLE